MHQPRSTRSTQYYYQDIIIRLLSKICLLAIFLNHLAKSLAFNNILLLWKHFKKAIKNNIIFYRESVTRNSSVFRRNIDNINIIVLLHYNILYLFIFRSQLTSIGDFLLGPQVYTINSGSTALT